MSKHKPINARPLINQKIREARKSKKLNQHQVAEKMGMLYDTYSKKERNGKITLDWLWEFCDAIQVSPSYFADVFGSVENPNEKLIFRTKETVVDRLYGKTSIEYIEPKPEIKKETEKC